MSGGQLDVLNAGHGHIELRFNTQDVIEIERAKRIIKDMLGRGYALFLEGKDKVMTRVKRFDETKGVYIIADGPEVAPVPLGEEEVTAAPKRGRGRPKKEREVPMTSAKATAVPRSAGG